MKEIMKTVWALFLFHEPLYIVQYFAYICGRIKKECNG